MNYFFLFCNVCLHTGITAQVPIMHFEFCKLKNIYTVYIFFVVVLPPQTCKFPRILDQRNMLSSTVKLAELSIRPSLGIFRGWRIWEGEEAFSYLSSSFFLPFLPREAKNPDKIKRHLRVVCTGQRPSSRTVHWRSPTLSYFARSSPEENKWALMVYGLNYMSFIVNTL